MNNITETMSDYSTGQAKTRTSLRRKSLMATGVGNLLEWFDWTIYTVASVYIAAALFDKSNATSALLNTLAVFAAGFLLRPIGAIFFGILAPIWCFMNGHKGLGIKFIIAFVCYLIGAGLGMGGAIANMPQ